MTEDRVMPDAEFAEDALEVAIRELADVLVGIATMNAPATKDQVKHLKAHFYQAVHDRVDSILEDWKKGRRIDDSTTA